jgi:signal transduction histidine kinase
MSAGQVHELSSPSSAMAALSRGMIIDELNALVRAKDELVHLMTHELRTPLLGIIGM